MIAIAQLDLWSGQCQRNTERIQAALYAANQKNAQLVIFPELSITGYPVLDHITQLQDAVTTSIARLRDTSAQCPKLYACIGTPVYAGDVIYNALIVLHAGVIIACYKKHCLPTYDVFSEHRYFTPGTDPVIIDVYNQRIGLTICEDAWHHDTPLMRYYSTSNLDYLVNASASPYNRCKPDQRLAQFGYIAKCCQASVIMVNQVGACDSLVFDGSSFCLRPDGSIHHQLPQFTPDLGYIIASESRASHRKTDAIYQALVMGISDFMAKTGVGGCVIGLSGGIDSAVVAAIAVAALGSDRVRGVYMPGPFSTPASENDAKQLANNLGIAYETHSIVDYMRVLTKKMGHLNRIALENAQARFRGISLMTYANQHGYMALATGNKSELAVGYSTLYGDMIGGLAPLGDVYKTQVYELAINHCPAIPHHTVTRAPSAELWPNQKDTDSLPPYAILDAILYYYIDNDYTRETIIDLGYESVLVNQIMALIHRSEHKRYQAPPVIKVSQRAFGAGWQHVIARP